MFEHSPHFRIQGLRAQIVSHETGICTNCQHDTFEVRGVPQPSNDGVDEANPCMLTLTFSLWATGDPKDERQLYLGYCGRCGSDAEAELELLGKATRIIENRWRDPAINYAITAYAYDSDEDDEPDTDLPKDSVP